jgi:hypothetical protein
MGIEHKIYITNWKNNNKTNIKTTTVFSPKAIKFWTNLIIKKGRVFIWWKHVQTEMQKIHKLIYPKIVLTLLMPNLYQS